MAEQTGKEGWKIPRHVAIILDGNGRWANKRFMPRKMGHVQGAKQVELICEEAWRMGIKYLTVYAFSTENWSRPQDEVDAIMGLLRKYMETCTEIADKNDMRVRVIGERSRLAPDMIEKITELEDESKGHNGLNFTIALNYGSRDEMLRAMRRMASDCAAGKIAPEQIDKDVFEAYLDTAGIPDPDLLIRTSGEQRLSNYLLWQMAYTEFYFTDVLWPDFDKKELEKAVMQYNKRDRRYGGVKETKDGNQ